ncbi:alpha/beta hydrolase [Ottowia sp. GY511]|uniref:Alpha/beta hydrolase n=1 Tax=Ottowia flava TaxID=2675430 RepID=A0ABW4KSS4_9BURK|nr:alpha/beta fold hydrolase [Ottowia sp. GY511]TXK29744.1 alpha/beta hydrolase [Ottowia sp. GY511]
MTISRFRLAVVAALGAAAFAGCAALDEKQRAWIFQPTDRTWGQSATVAEGMQDVWIDFDSRASGQPVRLHGLWHPADARAACASPVLLYLHGARWDVRGSASRIRRMQELGFSVLAIDYRGFGKSSAGLPSEAMALEDARAAWDWLARQHPDALRFIFGHSLGGGVAVQLAEQVRDQRGLILEGTFTSIPDVARTMKWGWLPVGPLITQRFDSRARIAQVGSPVLVVHGSEDRLIPPALGRQLFDAAAEPKRFVLVEGGSHHNTNSVGQDQYRAALPALFGDGCFGAPPPLSAAAGA